MSEQILKYPGGKRNIVDELIKYVPEHKIYLEPFFGGGTLFFAKDPAAIETINDKDSDVVNLFRVIKDHSEKLARTLLVTPYSKQIYEESYIDDTLSEIDRACRFLVKCWQGYGSRGCSSRVGFKTDIQKRERMYALWDWYNLPVRVIEVAERLRKVQIENRPAAELINAYNNEDTFMYLDPPYVFETRTKSNRGRQYNHEMSDSEHEQLLKTIVSSRAKVMISGYDSDMYNDYLRTWYKRSFNSCSSGGSRRREVIWMNYEDNRQMTLDEYMMKFE